MIRDIVRTACVLLTMSVAAGLLVEVRYQIAAIDLAHRRAMPVAWSVPPAAAPEPAPLRRLGRSALDLADAALGVVR